MDSFMTELATAADYALSVEGRVELEELLSSAWSSGDLLRSIQSILCDSESISTLARQSYLHPNGFEKYLLVPSEHSACRIRLHIWRPERKESFDSANYHNHFRDFASLVICGSLTDCVFSESALDEPNSLAVRKYQVFDRPVGSEYSYIDLGPASLRPVSERCVDAGSTYSQAYSVIHRTQLNSGSTMYTLFVQGPERSPYSFGYSVNRFTPEKDAGAGCLTPAQYAMGLQELIRVLSN
jgi:hypothetical protein